MATKVQLSSRFSVLKVEDGYDSDEQSISDTEQPKKAVNPPVGAKKKSKQKKTGPQKAGHPSLVHEDPKLMARKNEACSDSQLAELEKRSNEYADGEFSKDLTEALISSRIKYEEMKQQSESNAGGQPSNHWQTKKKKDKSITLTWDQFSQRSLNNFNHSRESRLESKPVPDAGIPDIQEEGNFFEKIDEDVSRIMSQERTVPKTKPHNTTIIIAPSKNSAAEETPEVKKQKKDLEIKDKEIIMLQTTRRKLEQEFQQVKKRNQQLLHMLGQGEMKEKMPILMEIEDLKQISEELTNELAQRNGELEEERSNVLVLKTEVDKLKVVKHGGK